MGRNIADQIPASGETQALGFDRARARREPESDPGTLEQRTATWRSGYAAACKAVYTGSIPVVASKSGCASGPVSRRSECVERRSPGGGRQMHWWRPAVDRLDPFPGRLAQLGERRLDKAEVTGSSPVSPIPGEPHFMGLFRVRGGLEVPNEVPLVRAGRVRAGCYQSVSGAPGCQVSMTLPPSWRGV